MEDANGYTVTGPGGGWINTHVYAQPGLALRKAVEQASRRQAGGLGPHTVEVRAMGGSAYAPRTEIIHCYAPVEPRDLAPRAI